MSSPELRAVQDDDDAEVQSLSFDINWGSATKLHSLKKVVLFLQILFLF